MYLFSSFLALSLATGLCSPVPLPTAGPSVPPEPACGENCQVDNWLLTSSIESLEDTRKRMWTKPQSEWEGIDWIKGSDQCSVPKFAVQGLHIDDKSKPRGYNFLPSCYRHDFGYGNYKQEGRFSEQTRERIDGNFRDDMYAECRKQPWYKEAECKIIAMAYYEGVRLCGGAKSGENCAEYIVGQ